MIEASCHCGAVRLEIEAEPPESVLSCQCSICRRIGGLWSYYKPGEVRVHAAPGATRAYIWGDKMLASHACATCNCTTHWTAVDPDYQRMGVNARMMAPEVLAGATVRVSPGPE